MLRLRYLALLCVCALAFPACDFHHGPPEEHPLYEAATNPGEWFFIQTEGMHCRDGSPTGFGVRFQQGARKLAIYLEGGGACFSQGTCATNPSSFSAASFDAFVAQRGEAGIFDPSAENPVGDWNVIYVPYCTGDIHGGSNPNAIVPGVDGLQQFVGHTNVERVLDEVAPVLGRSRKVLLTGASAGGFGTLANFVDVADTFEHAQLTLLNDSGPIFFADDVFSPQIGGLFTQLYNLPAAFPADAAPLFLPDGLEGIYGYLADRYPHASLGLASFTEDAVIRGFFGPGQPDFQITGPEYAAGLEGIRAEAPERWATYYAPGADHTFIASPSRYFGSLAGVPLNDWLGDLIAGTSTDVGPAPPRLAQK